MNKGAPEEHAASGQLVEIRGAHDVVHPAGPVDLGVGPGVPTPVVGEGEEDVQFALLRPRGDGEEQGGKRQQQAAGHGGL